MNFFSRLNPREKLFVSAGGGLLLLVLLLAGGKAVYEKRRSLSEETEQARADLQTLQRLKGTIESLPAAKGQVTDINAMKSAVFTRLERNNLKADIRERVENISQREERLVIEVIMRGITLNSTVDFLHDIEFERSVNAKVGKLNLRRSLPDRDIYDVTVTLTLNRPRQGGK